MSTCIYGLDLYGFYSLQTLVGDTHNQVDNSNIVSIYYHFMAWGW